MPFCLVVTQKAAAKSRAVGGDVVEEGPKSPWRRMRPLGLLMMFSSTLV